MWPVRKGAGGLILGLGEGRVHTAWQLPRPEGKGKGVLKAMWGAEWAGPGGAMCLLSDTEFEGQQEGKAAW